MFGTQALATAPHSDEELAGKFVSGLVSLPPLSTAQAERLVLAYRRSYPEATPAEMLIGTWTWAMFTGHAIAQAELGVKAGGQVFMYRFDWECPAFGGMYAPHEGEVALEFGNVDYRGDLWEPGGNDSPATRAAADPHGHRYQVSERMINMWSEFARKGNPSTPTVSWPQYSLERRETMVIDADSRIVDDPNAGIRRDLA